MAKQAIIMGTHAVVFIDDIVVGCAKSFALDLSRKEIPTSCVDSGDLEQTELGRMKAMATIEMTWRQTTGADVATNFAAYEAVQKILTNATAEIEFKDEAELDESVVYFLTCKFKNVKLNGTLDEEGTISADLVVNDLDVFKFDATP
jgi:hypothetical protein